MNDLSNIAGTIGLRISLIYELFRGLSADTIVSNAWELDFRRGLTDVQFTCYCFMFCEIITEPTRLLFRVLAEKQSLDLQK